jgi:hypothetical protein
MARSYMITFTQAGLSEGCHIIKTLDEWKIVLCDDDFLLIPFTKAVDPNTIQPMLFFKKNETEYAVPLTIVVEHNPKLRIQ